MLTGEGYLHRLPGPPLSHKTQIVTLLDHNVTVGLGTIDADKTRNTRFDAGWVRNAVVLSI